MTFITTQDLDVLIRNENLQMVTSQSASIVDMAELQAIEEMTAYLRAKYDVAAIFSASGTARNSVLVMYCIDIMMYHVHTRITPRQIPQVRIDRYNLAKEWLNKVQEGLIIPTLPENTGNPPGSNPDAAQGFRTGSNDKFSHQF